MGLKVKRLTPAKRALARIRERRALDVARARTRAASLDGRSALDYDASEHMPTETISNAIQWDESAGDYRVNGKLPEGPSQALTELFDGEREPPPTEPPSY